jgi:hypothetical protein
MVGTDLMRLVRDEHNSTKQGMQRIGNRNEVVHENNNVRTCDVESRYAVLGRIGEGRCH